MKFEKLQKLSDIKYQESLESIKGMDYQEAVDKHLEAFLDEPLLPEYSFWVANRNEHLIHKAKKKIYKSRGLATIRDDAKSGVVFGIIALILGQLLDKYYMMCFGGVVTIMCLLVIIFLKGKTNNE